MILSWGYVQDERYIAIEHMDVRRDCVSFAHMSLDVLCKTDTRRSCASCARGIPFILNISES
ncbi:MAG: hypothetical protein QNK19_17120, partial [Xanthomonadales bacterium]|nr:hypothetical protein [Xanthomonadales bacterium]